MRLEHPEYLCLGLAVPLLIWMAHAWWQWRQDKLVLFGDTRRILAPLSKSRFYFKIGLRSVALLLLAIAWANPQSGAKKQNTTQKSADVFILLDISNSMLCQDMPPNRLAVAKIFADRLVQNLAGERIGLILFAGTAFRQMPLSTDYSFLRQCLREANTDLLSYQGTNIPFALDMAGKSFDPDPGGGRAVIVITDIENNEDFEGQSATDAAEQLFEDHGAVTYAIGVGTPEGGPIPAAADDAGAFKRDENGQIIRSRFDETALRKLALAGHGAAYHINQSDRVIAALRNEVDALQKRDIAVRSSVEFESWYQWFLLPALMLLFVDACFFWVKNFKQPLKN
jgi:Ca-activated chloride channel homolog